MIRHQIKYDLQIKCIYLQINDQKKDRIVINQQNSVAELFKLERNSYNVRTYRQKTKEEIFVGECANR